MREGEGWVLEVHLRGGGQKEMIELSNATISKNNQQIAKEKRKAAILTMMSARVMDENMFEGKGGGVCARSGATRWALSSLSLSSQTFRSDQSEQNGKNIIKYTKTYIGTRARGNIH
jgi:hypothetical protein